LLDVIRPRVEKGLKFVILLTKADKLNKTEAAKALSITKLQAGGGDVKMFSALKRIGVDEMALHLRAWAAEPLVRSVDPIVDPVVDPVIRPLVDPIEGADDEPNALDDGEPGTEPS
jgi:GTP-binding protein